MAFNNDIELIWDAIGDQQFAKFCEVFGGQRIYIPHVLKLHDEHSLVVAMGAEAARAICRAVSTSGGTALHLDVPKYETSRSKTEASVLRLAKRGKSANEIARETGISRRHVFGVKARLKRRGQL
jgi:DNA-binding CsgD family transcriptional regulator